MTLVSRGPIQQPFEARRSQINQSESMEGGPHTVFGFVDVKGSGELTFNINFPVAFIQKPSMAFGGELGPNQAITATEFPTVSLMVKSWIIEQSPDKIATYYIGASMVGVMLGSTDLAGTFHYQFTGDALRAPLADPGIEGTI